MNKKRAIMISALSLPIAYVTKNLMVGVGSLAVFLVPLILIKLINFVAFAGKFTTVINMFALFDKVSGFIHGIFDITSLLYYVTVALVFLFFSIKVMEMRRCR